MSEDVADLLMKALALPMEARAALAGSLLDTLDDTVDEDAEASWEKEIASRIEQLDAGTAKTVSWTELRGRMAAKLSHRA
jgi:putative addiction module component (TIGR02574 family)